jgi:hypothetical protein
MEIRPAKDRIIVEMAAAIRREYSPAIDPRAPHAKLMSEKAAEAAFDAMFAKWQLEPER